VRWEVATVVTVVVLLVVAFFLFWAGATLLIDAWLRRPRRPDLAERLRSFASTTIGDEAEEWLERQ
jgi:hypothetical protein